MGLVNLRKAKLLLLSLSPDNLQHLEAAAGKAGYRSPVLVRSVPEAIAALKTGKIDVIVADTDLGGTAFADFAKALKAAFPKAKLLEAGTPELSFPIQADPFGKAVDRLMMEKMGIAASGVTVKDDF